MLDNKELFAREEGADRGKGHVRTADAGLVVEGGKPLLGEDAQSDRWGLDRSDS